MSTFDLILGGGVILIAVVAILANNYAHTQYAKSVSALAQTIAAKLETVGTKTPPTP